MADYDDTARYEDDRDRGYERDRSASPRGDRGERTRSRSPNGRADDRAPPAADTSMKDLDDDGAINTGSNLFVTGIHPRLTEADVSRLFEKYGEVENCSIMVDPHTKESRGFGFVKMVTSEQAEAAKEGLQGEVIEGRTLSIERARRARPRTPTPGKYFGPPKRSDFRRPPPGRFGDRYDDRRGGYGRRGYDDGYRSSRYDPYDRRERRERDDYGGRGIDRYASSRDDRDRYAGREDRRGYYGRDDDRGYSREERGSGYSREDREYTRGGYESREDRYATR